MWTVPGPVASMSISTFSGGVGGVFGPGGGGGGAWLIFTFVIAMLSSAGAGLRPEIGTPSCADW
jgi:hypothetical protein